MASSTSHVCPSTCVANRDMPMANSFSVNGEKQEGGFDGVEGEVFPCAGSYRSGVTIRLLKVGVFGAS